MSFDDDLASGFNAIAESFPLTKNPYVVTMTVGATTNFRAPSLDALVNAASSSPGIAARPFRNCIIMKLDPEVYGCKITCKVFVNGYLHMTGSKTLEQADDAATKMVLALSRVFKISEAELDVTEYDVQMINTSFATGKFLYMDKVVASLRDKLVPSATFPRVEVTYDKDVYHGIKVSLFTPEGKKTTVCIFKRGVFIVTGLRDAIEFEPAARFVLTAFQALPASDFITETAAAQQQPSTTKKKRKMMIDDIAASLGL
jgi:TATA-box binding protein (TBP) (component of TFIID and TFIIIB)